MEELPSHPVLRPTWEEVNAVRRECNMEELRYILDGINNIREWYRMQPHMLKEHLETPFVERVLLLSRGSVELAKKKIDAIAVVRTMLPEFYVGRDVDSEEFRQLSKFVRPVPLPSLAKDLTRVIMVQMTSKSEPNMFFNPLSFYRLITLINDTRMYVDYIAGDTYVIDMDGFKLMDFVNFNISLTKKVQVITAAYGIKLKGIHFINAPSYIDKVVFILKQGLKDKIADRIHVHSSLEEFYKFVPKECLPVDYGGPHPSMDLLYGSWMKHLKSEESQKQAESACELKTDESKRLGARVDEEMLGIPGSFRTLSVD